MFKVISSIILTLVTIGLVMNFTFNNDNNKSPALHPAISLTGDETPVLQNKPVVQFDENNFEPVYYTDSVIAIFSIRTGPETIYDIQSNSTPQQLWQDPNDDNLLHATFMVNLTPGWPAANRRCYYMLSTDKGVTWDNYGPNPTTGSNGYCVCSGLSDGRAVLGGHTDNGIQPAPVRFQLFVDAAPGAGNFTRLDPGANPFNTFQVIWGRIMPTSSVSNTTKIVFMGAMNTSADTLAYMNRALSLTTSSFSGYAGNPLINNTEAYCFARANDGRIGLAYVANDNSITTNLGDVHYVYSTDQGVTWSAPVTAWDAPVYLEDGVFGCLRGLSLTYIGTTPKVAFELMGLTATGYYPAQKAAIGFWSPDVNGGVGFITPFDSTWSFNGNGGATDIMTSICRPSISKSKNEQLLMMTFLVSRADTDAIGSHFYDVYITWSTNGGSVWKFPPSRLTNNTGPLRDCRYASLSPSNDFNSSNNDFYANLLYQSDSIPGCVALTPPAAESLAKQWFARVTIHPVIGIQNISSDVPKNFSLSQNFPNPFNPTTKIRFAIPKETNVTLEVYDITGRLIATLAQNEHVTAGLKEVDFNANGLASGIYIYTIKAGDFRDSKKMILVK